MPTDYPNKTWIGKYHDIDCVNYVIDPETTTFNWYEYDYGDENNPNHYATSCGESFNESSAEVAAVAVWFGDAVGDSVRVSGGVHSIEFRKSSNDNLVLRYEIKIHDPSDCNPNWSYWVGPLITIVWVGKGFEHSGCSQSNPCLVWERDYSDFGATGPCNPVNGGYYPIDWERMWYYEAELDEPGEYYVVISSPTHSRTIYFNFVKTAASPAFVDANCHMYNVTKGTEILAGVYEKNADIGDIIRFDYEVKNLASESGLCRVEVIDENSNVLDYDEFTLGLSNKTGSLMGSKVDGINPYDYQEWSGYGFKDQIISQKKSVYGVVKEMSFYLSKNLWQGEEPDGEIWFEIWDTNGNRLFSIKWGNASDITSSDITSPVKCTVYPNIQLRGEYFFGVKHINCTTNAWVNAQKISSDVAPNECLCFLNLNGSVIACWEDSELCYELKYDTVVTRNTDLVAKTYYWDGSNWIENDVLGCELNDISCKNTSLRRGRDKVYR